MACHISADEYVGLIGNVGAEHDWWGRPEVSEAHSHAAAGQSSQGKLPKPKFSHYSRGPAHACAQDPSGPDRPVLVWGPSAPGSDLMAAAASALAAASLAFNTSGGAGWAGQAAMSLP